MTKFRNQQPVLHTGPLCNGKVTHVTGARAWAEAKRYPDAPAAAQDKTNHQPGRIAARIAGSIT